MAFARCQSCYKIHHNVCNKCHTGGCCKRGGMCNCRACQYCNKTHNVNRYCERCETCKNACRCHPSIPHYDSRLLDPLNTQCYTTCTVCKGNLDVECKNCKNKRTLPTFAVNPLRRALGIEVELAEWGTLPIANGFVSDGKNNRIVRYQAVHDGSVRPSNMEMVISPLAGDRFVLGMVGLSSMIDYHQCTINNTCGLHVHVDGSDFSAFDIRRLLYALDRIEPELYSMCSPTREASSYCFPLMNLVRKLSPSFMMDVSRIKDSGEIKAALYKMFYMVNATVDRLATEEGRKYTGKRLKKYPKLKKVFFDRSQVDEVTEMIQAKYGPMHRLRHLNRHDHLDNLRYAGVNLQSWLYRGSIEFRMKEGTTSPRDLMMWPLLCGWIVEAISRLTDNQVLKSPTLNDLLSTARVPQGIMEYVEKIKAIRR